MSNSTRSEHYASINVDPAEVAKFEQLASRWWDRNSEFKPLHDINPLRANWIDKLAPVAEKKVLDVGCGGGILCEALAQRGASVTGIDMGEAPLAVGKLHQLESGVEVDYQKSTAEAFAQDHAESFDCYLPRDARACARPRFGGRRLCRNDQTRRHIIFFDH